MPLMLGFLIFAVAFVAVLTLVVRLAGLHVRASLSYGKALGLTTLFVGVLLLAWWAGLALLRGPACR